MKIQFNNLHSHSFYYLNQIESLYRQLKKEEFISTLKTIQAPTKIKTVKTKVTIDPVFPRIIKTK